MHVQLYIGDSYSYTVGSVIYVDSYCNDPSHNCPALIGGIVGGVGGGLILIVIIIIIAVVCIRQGSAEKRRRNALMARDPLNYYICKYQ
jgi:hypothetical protein